MAGAENEKITAPDQLETLKQRTFYGREKDNAIYPIALANLVLHDIDDPHICTWYYDLSDVNVGKKNPLTLAHFEEFFRLLRDRADSDRSWTVTGQEIDEKGYDLKAVNPRARGVEDRRTPEELLDIIEAMGRDVADAVASLRALLGAEG